MRYYPPVSPYQAGLASKCPRCGQGGLYVSFLKLQEQCDSCQLDYAKADSGDGPAVFIMFIVGFISVCVAFVLRFTVGLPIGLAFLVSFGLAIILSLALLRPLKSTLIALQYANKVAEARLEEDDDQRKAAFGEEV